MNITKVINNNVVSSKDENGNEVLIMGKGLGFQKKVGDALDQEKIEKVFALTDEVKGPLEQVLREIPYEHVHMANRIIHEGRKALNKDLNKNIYVTLTDHLNYAIERAKKGQEFQNALLWEIRKYYPQEYACGQQSIHYVKEKTGIELSDDEAGFIALHFLNAEMDSNLKDTMNMPEMIKDILNVVKYTLMIEYDEDSLSYERFVTHLKFFIQRAVANQYYDDGDEAQIFRNFIKDCPEEYACALKIKTYMESQVEYEFSEEELFYLTLHIHRLMQTAKRV